jgi:hypothetical protein
MRAPARALHRCGSGLAAGFHDAVSQAEAEFREAVGTDVATVVALGLEAYAEGY